jgi:sigma-B regulation protein RsbU (phosphoserine phosphatase)
VLLIGAGAAGARTPVGLALIAASVAYLALDLLFLQRRLEQRMLAPSKAEIALEQFLEHASNAVMVEEVAEELTSALQQAIDPGARVALVAPEPKGGIRLISVDRSMSGIEVSDGADAFLWLGEGEEPLWREELEGISDTGAVASAELMDRVNANVLLPLRHRGLLLGLALISSPSATRLRSMRILRALRVYTTAALANVFLEAEAKGRSSVTETLGLANAIQESLMPEERPVRRPQWELRGFFRPMAECGGDLWLWRELGNDQVLLVIADATGHGAGPALLSAVAKGTIDAYAQVTGASLDPGKLLEALNEAIYRVGRRHYMMTAFAAVVDCRGRNIRFANAAQNFPFMLSGGTIEVLVARGNSLGAAETVSYRTHERPMHPGDKVLLYTDGIVEAGAPTREPYGERRFRRLVGTLATRRVAQITEDVLDAVHSFIGNDDLHDDMTMLAFECISEDLA